VQKTATEVSHLKEDIMCRAAIRLVVVLSTLFFVSSIQAQLPAGWTSIDVGGPAAAGSAQYQAATDSWTITGDGTGIMGTSDQFRYVYKTLNGNGELIARVASIDPPLSDYSMAGVMIRVVPNLPGSPFIFMGVSVNSDTRDHGVMLYYRTALGGATLVESAGTMTAPYWVKVSRTGDTFAGAVSPDGKTWTEVGSDTASGIPSTIYIGYAVTSSVAGKAVTAVFDRGPAKASEPSPADKAIHVSIPVLQWKPGVGAASHNLYYGLDPTPGQAQYVANLPLAQNGYVCPLFDPDTTYYWRVDEIAADGKTVYTGDVWSFTSAPTTAYEPEPWDGLQGVDVEANLAWLPGVGAVSHDVYFGTDKAAVRAGDPTTSKGNQLTLKFEPGTLAPNTTYYWRIDEHSDDGTVRTGTIWSFKTVGPDIGVQTRYFKGTEAEGDPVLTQVENAINHDWGSGVVAAGLSDNVSAIWTADLWAPFSQTYRLYVNTDDGSRLSLDGRLLLNRWDSTVNEAVDVDLVGGQIYRLQMVWHEDGGSARALLSWESPSIPTQIIPAGPLLLPLWATAPYPANTSVDVPQDPLLHWSSGDSATDHDVYFGDDAEAVADADTTTVGVYRGRQAADAVTYEPGTLEWGKTYYWRVDEVNAVEADSPWRGSVWSFTTADFIIVDDFESYTNDVTNRIFQTWIDGYGYTEPVAVPGNGTGAVVGHDIWSASSPYYGATIAETRIVHGGAQSMPMDYSNGASPFYSQADRTWAMPQDWTVNGMNTLVLYVRGLVTNGAAPLYVTIQDRNSRAATVTHPDAAVLTSVQWVEWKIPLNTFTDAGASVTAVKKMSIGAGDPKAPKAGGAGSLYLDDIRVIKSE
jgi:hypothetical protein